MIYSCILRRDRLQVSIVLLRVGDRENWMKNREMIMINEHTRVQHVPASQHIT